MAKRGEPHTAVLLIDCQQAFVDGCWAQHFGPAQVAPIVRAFEATAAFLQRGLPEGCALCATFCPFWDARDRAFWTGLRRFYAAQSPALFSKPENDVLDGDVAPSFGAWVAARRRLRRLVVGGCTLTSCVRVSALSCVRELRPLRVCVDLSLCGARLENYAQRPLCDPLFPGVSPVESALEQLRAAGVELHETTESWARDGLSF